MNKELPLIITLVLLVGVQAYSSYIVIEKTQETNTYLKEVMEDITSYKLYAPENERKLNVNGVYFSDKDYYCVKTEGRDYTDIRMTDYHEMCHAFIDMDFQHFCNSSNQTNWDIEAHIR